MGVTPDDRILVVGHSYGGNRARLFAQQLLNNALAVDGLVTIDPIDWDSCRFLDPSGVLHIDSHCNFSSVAMLKPSGVHYVLAYTQTQSIALDGYHLAIPGFEYPYTILNDPSCLPGPLNPLADYFCSHGNLGGNPTVHTGTIQLGKQVLQSSDQIISAIQASSVGTTSATITWNTRDDTAGGTVFISAQANFSNSTSVQEAPPSGPSKLHTVSLSGLLSNTTYYFKVQVLPPGASSATTSAVQFFRTTPTVPIIRATSPSITVGTDAATLQFILVDSGAPISGVSILSAKIGSVATTTPLPLSVSDLGPVQSPLVSLVFPKTLGATGTTVVPTVTLKFSGGTITVGVPPTKLQ